MTCSQNEEELLTFSVLDPFLLKIALRIGRRDNLIGPKGLNARGSSRSPPHPQENGIPALPCYERAGDTINRDQAFF